MIPNFPTGSSLYLLGYLQEEGKEIASKHSTEMRYFISEATAKHGHCPL